MLFLIPTAKEMTQANTLVSYNLPTKVETIIKTMAAFSPQELEKIYRIKRVPALAGLFYKRAKMRTSS